MSGTRSTSISKGTNNVADGIVLRAPGLRILFVEDHCESRRVIAKLLSHSGHNVSVAECAGTALHMLNADKFDVILSDIGLPDGSGYALIMLAKQCQPSIIAIALTGFSAEEDIKFSREVGFDFHLTKPVDFHELRTVLKQARVQTGASTATCESPAARTEAQEFGSGLVDWN
jgi:CheY-like chemotaxis protein